ncbi:uncharacterized protein [Halyomorpha halys]|uniref:uncharacterized protein n=1 Tax=Halyomorpha halys TaxID=286706 RepID=UPI0034D3619B
MEIQEFQRKQSGWALYSINNLELCVNQHNPFYGSSYIDLPKKIKDRKAIINVKNNDEKCFLYAIKSALYPAERDGERVSKYINVGLELDEIFKKEKIEFPVELTSIQNFEKKSNISINVYTYEDNGGYEGDYAIYPLYHTKNKQEKHVNLLLIKDETSLELRSHYCWIKNLSKLISSQTNNHNGRIYTCDRCLRFYNSKEQLDNHENDCKANKEVKIDMPEKGDQTTFKKFNRKLRVPFAVYADFECLLPNISTCQPNPDKSYTKKYQKHKPISFSYYIKYSNGNYKEPVVYVGEDAPKKFVEMLKQESEEIKKIYSKIEPIIMTNEDKINFENSKICHICEEAIIFGEKKVRDHDHLTGKYRGAAHENCNNNYKNPSFLPVYVHNLANYDVHLFINELGIDSQDIDAIPNNEERYISFSKKVEEGLTLRFLDTFKFMASSIDKLSSNLKREQFRETAKYFEGEQLDLIIQKGVYPYEYMNSVEKLKETKLPTKECFYSRLNKSNISNEDYERAKLVWNKFNIKNLEEYTKLYNKSDVLILADIFENFRDTCIKAYKLDPSWYFTAPGLSWDAMLKITKIELDLLNDYDMILMLEKGIRGGISQSIKRYAKANNKYMKNYNSKEETSYLEYLDANNLYGWAMSQYLPYGGFEWLNNNYFNDKKIKEIPDNYKFGYIFEVDLEYPKELHDLHKDLPLAPEGGNKLLTTLNNKEKYVLHYRNLKKYLYLGLKLTKIHRVLTFKQSDYLKKYIDLNTEMRTKATNDFEKDFYKLMNNSVFGKTMENIRNRKYIKLLTDPVKYTKYVSKPNYEHTTIFSENLVAVHMKKIKVKFDKPIYIGMSILDISKIKMYDFHYNVMKPKYGENIDLCYMDTDSFIYYIKTNDFYNDIKTMIDEFDTSDYSKDNVYGLPLINKKVLGKMKDENCGNIMTEHVSLKSKMYAYKVNEQEYKKSKGVKKLVVKNEITFDDYKQCLETKIKQYRKINLIRSYKHELYTVESNKIVLSSDDDKRYILENGIDTL